MKNQQGFANIAFLSFLPILVISFLTLLFSQYLTKNWMQALHTCRTELLSTQNQVGKDLKRLMEMNKVAGSLRMALQAAYVELAAAIAAENPGWVAKVRWQIQQIKTQQKILDASQKTVIALANFKLNAGVYQVMQKIYKQNAENQARLPDFFRFQIKNILPFPTLLAVRPDKADIAPVYELKQKFNEAQAIHVSWISYFQTTDKGPLKWLINSHSKEQYCQVTLKPEGNNFLEVLKEDRL